MAKSVYIIKVEDTPIFATSLFAEFEGKKFELIEKGIDFNSQFSDLNNSEHLSLLKECTKNIIDMNRKSNSMKMEDKS